MPHFPPVLACSVPGTAFPFLLAFTFLLCRILADSFFQGHFFSVAVGDGSINFPERHIFHGKSGFTGAFLQ
jgi:hypothetical protein